MIASIKKMGIIRIVVHKDFVDFLESTTDTPFDRIFDYCPPLHFEGYDNEHYYYTVQLPIKELDEMYKDFLDSLDYWVKEYKKSLEEQEKRKNEDFHIWE